MRKSALRFSPAFALLVGCSQTGAPYDPDAPWVEIEDGRVDAFQTALEQARDEQGVPGMAMAVAYRDTHELWVGAVGESDLDAGREWEVSQPFRIGSVTKTFTTAAVFQLAEEGVLDLDDPIEQWVPGWWEGPTLRHLLGHSSGIVSYNYVGSFDASRAWAPDELVQWAWDQESALRFEPGTDWEYSNTNYVLLGMVVEAATGQSYEAVLAERFFEPLALTGTRMAGAGDVDPDLVRSYEGDPPVDNTTADDPSMGWAAGGAVSTPADVARWQVAPRRSLRNRASRC